MRFLDKESGSQNIGKMIAMAWVFVATVYVFVSLLYPMLSSQKIQDSYNSGFAAGSQQASSIAVQSFSGNVFQNGYTKAVYDLSLALSAQVKDGCKNAVPVTLGSGSLGVVSLDCLRNGTGSAAHAPSASDAQK